MVMVATMVVKRSHNEVMLGRLEAARQRFSARSSLRLKSESGANGAARGRTFVSTWAKLLFQKRFSCFWRIRGSEFRIVNLNLSYHFFALVILWRENTPLPSEICRLSEVRARRPI